MLLIKNGYVIDPQNNMEGKMDILVEDGKIKEISPVIDTKNNMGNHGDNTCNIINATGYIVSPGLVDVHVHFRDPGFTYKEDIFSGAQAALRGGFTSVVLMANTKPAVDNEETLKYILEKGRQTSLKVYTCAAVTRGLAGKELVKIKALRQSGAVGFTDDGIPIMDTALLDQAMRLVAECGVPISLHEENPALITNNGINRGKASAHFEIGGSPREAEYSLIERDLEIALKTGVILNIQHISTKEGVALVREAKKRGKNIHAEATPHHFSLTEEAAITYGTLAKMNPPLREEEDRRAIIEGLRDGTIDIIATDHAPHSKEEKERPLTEAPSGIIGLETALPLALTNLVGKEGFSIGDIITLMSSNPAKLYGLEAGTLSVGSAADIVIFDATQVRKAGNYASKSQNSPFTGMDLTGVVKYTIVNGEIVYQDKNN